MPMIKEEPLYALCPYCWNGHVIFDKETNTFYCAACKFMVKQ